MYLRMPKRLHLELTDKCNAKCPMCARTDINGLGDSALVRNIELTYDDISRAFDGIKFEHVNYCGNLGDPMVATDLLEIVRYFAPTKQTIHTNGSLRTKSYFEKLAEIPNLVIVFGIDGIDQQSHEYYRRGTNFDKIVENVRAFNTAGGKSIWQMIVFDHNEHMIERAREMSVELGFHMFETLQTRRFYVDDQLQYTYKGEQYVLKKPASSPLLLLDPDAHYDYTVKCQASQQEEVYIAADGQVWPCCYIYNSNTIDRDISGYNIKTKPFKDIVFGSWFDQVEQSFTDDPMLMCAITCGISHKNKRSKVINIRKS